MAKIINETRNIRNNIFDYETKLQSPYNRFIDRTGTEVTYFHLSDNNTTVNEGFQDAETYIGSRSPIRFVKINNFPLYGISQIVFNLNEDEQGLDIGYEGEAIILPHTIQPYQNDYFIINHLNKHDSYLFRVTAIEYDNVHPDNYYKIQFKLEDTGIEKVMQLEKQCLEVLECITENIGTNNKCLIASDKYTHLVKIKSLYEDIANTYLSIFYNERYNVLLGNRPCGIRLYDPYMIEFVNKHNLFNYKHELTTYVFGQELEDPMFKLKYEKSVWRFLERRIPTDIHTFRFYLYKAITLKYTIFANYYDETVLCVDIPLKMLSDEATDVVFSDTFVSKFKDNKENEFTDAAKLLVDYLKNREIPILSIPLNLNENILALDNNLETFFITPMILYILKNIINETMGDGIIKAVAEIEL